MKKQILLLLAMAISVMEPVLSRGLVGQNGQLWSRSVNQVFSTEQDLLPK